MNTALLSNCPSSMWFYNWTTSLHQEHFTYIDIGANKGFNINKVLYALDPSYTTTAKQWKHLFGKDCGVCNDCEENLIKTNTMTKIDVIAIELSMLTSRRLKYILWQQNINATIFHAAAGNKLGYTFENKIGEGDEDQGISTIGTKVPMITVDYIMQTLMLKSIDYLKIDAEGFDKFVLDGARNVLKDRKVKRLQFEYHASGEWGKQSLRDVILMFRNDSYTCFWIGNRGHITKVSIPCIHNFKKWSNIMCRIT